MENSNTNLTCKMERHRQSGYTQYLYCCSNCGSIEDFTFSLTHYGEPSYCPNCGAKIVQREPEE